MIVPHKWQFLRMLRSLGWPLLALVVWDVLVVGAYQGMHWEWVGTKSIPLALYGSVIGIIVGFRNNSAYSRWWEARGLWGAIVNHSRSFARQVCAVVRPTPGAEPAESAECDQLRASLVHLQIAYVHALRQQMRGLDPGAGIRSALSPAEINETDLAVYAAQKNAALAVQCTIAAKLREARAHGWVSALEWQSMDGHLDGLMNAQGGAERIRNTPLPRQYEFFPMLFVRLYCVLLPVGMVESLGWFTPLGSTLVGFMFLALDQIGRDLENPFDNSIYDVPLTAICNTIETNLRQMLGETPGPAPAVPVEGVLW